MTETVKQMDSMVLYKAEDASISVTISAEIHDGKLEISGHEIGSDVEESWGEEEYEYWYSFTEKNTDRLLQIIGAGDDPKIALLSGFSGENGLKKLLLICDENEIHYNFSSYLS